MRDETMKPSANTRKAEEAEARTPAAADREATDDEARRADEHTFDPEASEEEQEMNERGARQKGEGRVPE